MQSNPTHYVDNKKLLEELVIHHSLMLKFKNDEIKKPKLSNYIGECILLIAKKLSNRPNFINYPFKEEMIGDGIENCLMYINNFDPAKSSNPFGYITQIIFFAFIRRITKEKRHLYTKHKVMQSIMIDNTHMEQSEWNEVSNQLYFENAHMNDFVKTYEEGIIKKKKVSKKTGIEHFFEEDISELKQEILIEDNL